MIRYAPKARRALLHLCADATSRLGQDETTTYLAAILDAWEALEIGGLPEALEIGGLPEALEAVVRSPPQQQAPPKGHS